MIGEHIMERVSKHNYYLDIAQTVSERSTCLRRRFGAIIVKDDAIVSTGYNGAPRGRINCCDIGSCTRETLGIPRGERYEMCRSLHSEMNAIISASREEMIGATLYMCCTDPKDGSVVGGVSSCMMCKRFIINAGITKVIIRENKFEYTEVDVADWIKNDDSLSGKFGY
jgi:dCMP deaminase